MLNLARQINEAALMVRQLWSNTPSLGIVLGSGLKDFADDLDTEVVIPFSDIPYFPQATALGHPGQMICGRLNGLPLVVFQGRYHLYEGHTPQQVTLSVRLLKALGAGTLVITNASGAVNPYYRVGDVMLIEDHVNLMFANPLVGVNDDNLGPRFPDMSAPYDQELADIALDVSRRENFTLHRGVYVSMLGPTYETRAEYRMIRRLGGDVVGMSTVPETIAARHAGMRVVGLAAISNVAQPDALSSTDGHEVLTAAATATVKLSKIINGITSSMRDTISD